MEGTKPMCRSVFFAQVIGVYLIVVTLAMLMYQQRFKKIMSECMSSPALMYCGGTISLLLGLLILIPHNVWVMQWPVLITLVGWYCVIQGAWRIFFPEHAIEIMKQMMAQTGFLFTSWIWFLIGLYLAWMGFTNC